MMFDVSHFAYVKRHALRSVSIALQYSYRFLSVALSFITRWTLYGVKHWDVRCHNVGKQSGSVAQNRC
jgi:hypothetical protein